MKFSHGYRLLKAIPGYTAGKEVSWCGDTQRFYFWQKRGEYDLHRHDMEGPKFSVEQVSDSTWFEPIGEMVDFIPTFPDRKALDEFIYLVPDCRMVDDVDVCRAINAMLNDKQFQERLYEFYKTEYNAFHKLNGGSNGTTKVKAATKHSKLNKRTDRRSTRRSS